MEAEAPADSEAVGLCESVLLPLTVEDAVIDPVPLPVEVGEPVALFVPVGDGVLDAVLESLPVLEGDAPAVIEAVGDSEAVPLPLNVEVGVPDEVPEPDDVGVLVAVPVGERLKGEAELDALGLLEGEAPEERDDVGLAVTVVLALTVEDAVEDPVPLPVEVGEPVALLEAV